MHFFSNITSFKCFARQFLPENKYYHQNINHYSICRQVMQLINSFLTLSQLIISILPSFPLKLGLNFKKKDVSFPQKPVYTNFQLSFSIYNLNIYKQMHKTCKNNEQEQSFKIYSKTQPSKFYKTLGEEKNINKKNQEKAQFKSSTRIKKQPRDKTDQLSLLNSKSFPNFLNTNGYIKIDTSNNQLVDKMSTKFFRSPAKMQETNRLYETSVKQQSGSVTRIATQQSKTPKFKRKSTIPYDSQLSTLIGSDLSKTKETLNQRNEMLHDYANLKKKLYQSQKKVEELTLKLLALNKKNYPQKIETLQKNIKQLEQNMNKKEIEIKQLELKTLKSEEQVRKLNKRINQLISQNQNCKAFSFNLNENGNLHSQINLDLDNSGIGFEMLSTAQYIGSLTDLQDEVHNKNKQIFDLNKVIDQLKIKQHVCDLKHQQNLRRIINDWQTKYRKLLNSYKQLKANKMSGGLMTKKKIDTKYLSQETSDFFNLSLSTDRSQVPYT